MQCLVASEPVRLAIGVKKVVRQMLEVAADTTKEDAVRQEAAKVAYGGIDRLLDLMGVPKRPAATSAKGAARIDLATILEAHPSDGPEPAPCTVDPVTELAKPADSGPSTTGDVLPPKQ